MVNFVLCEFHLKSLKKELLKRSSRNIFSPHVPVYQIHQSDGRFPTHLSLSIIKRGWSGCHAQRKLTAHLLGLIRAILAIGSPVANPLIGDARLILTLELISLTFVFH